MKAATRQIDELVKTDPHAAFLAACKLAGRDPKTIRDPLAYIRSWVRAGAM